MAYVLDLFKERAGPAIIGGKAANLAELHRAGFNVPRALAVTTEAFREWRTSGLTDPLREELLSAFRSLRAPVAVRSSSPAEDLANASFAGQYVTVLGVRDASVLLDAIEQCWCSASAAAPSAYKKSVTNAQPAEMAVIIQELVHAEVAGVLFTLDPVKDRADQVAINSNFGLGESVVSGRVEPDTFILCKETGTAVEVRVGSKRIITCEADDRVAEVALDEHRRQALSLSEQQLRILLDAARRLEDWFDAPMDSEWAFVGNLLCTLQARPVTTGFPAYHAHLLDQWARDRGLNDRVDAEWTRGSVLSGLRVSPLYYSEMSAFFADMFVRIAALHGAPPIKRKIFAYYKGFTYTDASFFSTADPAGELHPESPFGAAWRSNLKIALRHPFSLAFWCNIDYYYRRWDHEWHPNIEKKRPDFTTATLKEIRAYIELLETQRRERSVVAGLAVGYAPNFLGLVAWLLRRWLPDAPVDTLGILTSGLPESLTHRENVELWELAQLAATRPHVSQQLLRGEFAELDQEFVRRVEAFRGKHAHRGCSDRDIFQARWGDSRELLLNQISMMLKLGADGGPEAAYTRAAARREAREQRLFTQLARMRFGFIRVGVFKRVLRTAQRYVMHRDNQRHTFEPYFYNLRLAYRAIGERLKSRGVLADRDDVFFLGKHEIYSNADGTLTDAKLSGRARWRRDWWERVSVETPPAHLRGYRPYEPVRGAVAADLQGAPGAPGIATGPVRKIGSLQELTRVSPGDIVVTYAIDPAWTPVFGIIAGVISVEGGMLAHAAVLGREYGLPVVLGVRDAIERLSDGDLVRIDGTLGSVTFANQEL